MRALGTGSDLLTCDGAPLAVGVAPLLRQVPPPPPARPEFHVPPAVLLRGGLSLPVAVAPPMTGCGSSARGLGGGRACEGLCSAVGGGGAAALVSDAGPAGPHRAVRPLPRRPRFPRRRRRQGCGRPQGLPRTPPPAREAWPRRGLVRALSEGRPERCGAGSGGSGPLRDTLHGVGPCIISCGSGPLRELLSTVDVYTRAASPGPKTQASAARRSTRHTNPPRQHALIRHGNMRA